MGSSAFFVLQEEEEEETKEKRFEWQRSDKALLPPPSEG